jgi:hypothetical protein
MFSIRRVGNMGGSAAVGTVRERGKEKKKLDDGGNLD